MNTRFLLDNFSNILHKSALHEAAGYAREVPNLAGAIPKSIFSFYNGLRVTVGTGHATT